MVSIADIQQRVAEDLDIEHLSPEDQERVVDELGGMLYKRMLIALFDKIPPHEHEKLKQLIASDAESDISDIIHKYVPDPGAVIAAEFESSMKDYREALAGSTS